MRAFTLDIHVPKLKNFLGIEFEDLTKKETEPIVKPALRIKNTETPENRKDDGSN